MAFSGRSEENARQAKELLFGVQNSRKARIGGLAGLLDPQLMARKKEQREEAARQGRARTTSSRMPATPGTASPRRKRSGPPTSASTPCSKAAAGFNSELFAIARTLLRAAEEQPKPNSERLREFRDSNLESLKFHCSPKSRSTTITRSSS